MLSLLVLCINLSAYTMVCAVAMCLFKVDFEKLVSFPKLVVIGSLLRIAWLCSQYLEVSPHKSCNDDSVEENRTAWVLKSTLLFSGQLAQICFLTAYSSVLFFWWQVLLWTKSTMYQHRARCNPSVIQVLFNLWVFVLWISMFVYRVFGSRDCEMKFNEGKEMAMLAVLFIVLSVGFVLVGANLVWILRTKESFNASKMQFKIIVICMTGVPLFVSKAVLLLQDAEGARTGAMVYPWFYFTLPEIVPSLAILYFMRKKQSTAIALEDAALLPTTTMDTQQVWQL